MRRPMHSIYPPSLDDERTPDHPHATEVVDLAALLGREVDRYGLVERQLLADAQILDVDCRRAGAVRLARYQEVNGFALLDGDAPRLEALVGHAQLDGLGLVRVGVDRCENEQRRDDCESHIAAP